MTTETQKNDNNNGYVTVGIVTMGTLGYKNMGGGKFLIRCKPNAYFIEMGKKELIMEMDGGFFGLMRVLSESCLGFEDAGKTLVSHPEAPKWAQALVRGASVTEVIFLAASDISDEQAAPLIKKAEAAPELVRPLGGPCAGCPNSAQCSTMVYTIDAVMQKQFEEALAEEHVKAMAEADAAQAEARQALQLSDADEALIQAQADQAAEELAQEYEYDEHGNVLGRKPLPSSDDE